MALTRSLRVFATIAAIVGLSTLALVIGVVRPRGAEPRRVTDARTAAAGTSQRSDASNGRVADAYGKLPLSFEVNVGQADTPARFLARGPGYGVALEPTQAVLALRRSVRSPATPSAGPVARARDVAETTTTARLALQFVGANRAAAVTGEAALPGVVNYLLGNDPAQWHRNVKTFGHVRYRDLYPGIDLVYYGNPQQLEHDFVVAPGADPAAIRLRFEGATAVTLADNGDVVVAVGGREVRLQAPVVYQSNGAAREPVAGRYVLDRDGTVNFSFGAYDRTRALVIDPVLVYSTYLGGGSGFDRGNGVAVDSAGAAYVTGSTTSTDFPAANPLQATMAGNSDAFVAKFAADGSALVYATYLGGTDDDDARSIAVDGSGAAYVTGLTYSTNFPIANPLQGAMAGTRDAFIAKLAADGSSLVYATYLGGSDSDFGFGIAVDSTGAAYVTGSTTSTNFPTANPLQVANAGSNDAFVAKLAVDGSALVYATYLGGSSGDDGKSIAVDSAGAAYVTGVTTSTNFPTANPLQVTMAGTYDAFVAKLAADGSALVYATYLGGSGEDDGWGIAVDSAGAAYATGYTGSINFPTTNPLQGANAGSKDGFVAKLAADGSALVYATYLGGSSDDAARGIAVDSTGAAYVTGSTTSTNFPTANALQGTMAGNVDAFVAKLAADGSALVYATYLGGSGIDGGNGIAVDSTGAAYVTGRTYSTNFPTANPLQAANASSDGSHDDAVVVKLAESPDLVVSSVSDPPASIVQGHSFNVTDTTANRGAAADASTTRYYLSTDTTITASDVLLTGTRSIPALGAGLNSSDTVSVTVPLATTPGAYYLGACADDLTAVTESSETNNCRASASTITVTVPSAPTVTSVSITGTLAVGQVLSGQYTYSDADSDAEGTSTFRWRRNASTTVGTSSTYTLVAADAGQTITFEVTPVATTGPSPGSAATSNGVIISTLLNGGFANGTTGWLQYATSTNGPPPVQDQSYMPSNVTAGVFQFYRVAPAAGLSNQAVAFQNTDLPFASGAPLVAQFDLGNTDTVRKRISVLVYDGNFSDLSVCTFWLDPSAALTTYTMRTHTTRAWTNASIAFYAASANAPGNTTGFYQLDNVSVTSAPSASAVQTACEDPTHPASGGVASGDLITNGDFGTSSSATPPTPWAPYGQIQSQVTATSGDGVFEFFKLTGAPAGVLKQQTGQSMANDQRMVATFQLGNSSGARQRVTVLVHDNNFTDLAACTFWLPAGQPLSSYSLRTFAAQAWTDATISFYPSTVGTAPTAQWLLLDSVTLARNNTATVLGTECYEPGATPPSGLDASPTSTAPNGNMSRNTPAARKHWSRPTGSGSPPSR